MKVGDFDFPEERRYLKGNLWLKEKKDSFRIGLTSLGASLAKEIVHIDLPENGRTYPAGEELASYETIKSVSSIALPFECTVKKANERLLDDPSLINVDCYGDGWILEASGKPKDVMDPKDAAQYYKKILDKEKERYKGVYD